MGSISCGSMLISTCCVVHNMGSTYFVDDKPRSSEECKPILAGSKGAAICASDESLPLTLHTRASFDFFIQGRRR